MIRSILERDYQDILCIKKELALDISRIEDPHYKSEVEDRGFLLPSVYTFEKFQKDLLKIFLVVEEKGKVIGFLRIDEEQDYSPTSPVNWISPEFKRIYYSFPHVVIGGVGLLPEYAHKGFAAQLLSDAIIAVKQKNIHYLFSLVTTSPLCNYPSLRFHTRNGFKKIAEREKGNTFDIKNYQSALFVNTF